MHLTFHFCGRFWPQYVRNFLVMEFCWYIYRQKVEHFHCWTPLTFILSFRTLRPTLLFIFIFINATLAGKSGHSIPLQMGLGSFTTTTEKIVGNFQSLNMTTDAQLSSPVCSPCGSPAHSSVEDKSHSQTNYGVGLWLGSRRNGGICFSWPI